MSEHIENSAVNEMSALDSQMHVSFHYGASLSVVTTRRTIPKSYDNIRKHVSLRKKISRKMCWEHILCNINIHSGKMEIAQMHSKGLIGAKTLTHSLGESDPCRL